MSDWDAARYHRLSEPQFAWGRALLARLAPAPGERILDVGCGTGRLTSEMAAAPGIRVVGLDQSAAMLSEAGSDARSAQSCDPRVARPCYVQADGTALPFAQEFDAVFSAATFHWIADHDRLFRGIYSVLRPGGRLLAQCGGANNLSRLIERTHRLMADSRYAQYYESWSDPWMFANDAETRRRLERAGFTDVEVSLEPSPVSFPDADAFAEFISCVCVRHHLDRLPAAARATFVAVLAGKAAGDDPPFTLDYWRLNLSARRGDR